MIAAYTDAYRLHLEAGCDGRAALSDRLKPMWTGAIYCGLLDACHELVDHRRASAWTDATRRWCSPLPVASLYPGICRVHTAEMLQLHGDWQAAEVEALDACRDMAGIDVFAVADGFYTVARSAGVAAI